MLTLLNIVIFTAAGLWVVLSPQPEPPLLFPEPRRSRREQYTLEEANTLDWIERVKETPERRPEVRPRRPVVTTAAAPPWLAAPTPPQPAATMVPGLETSPDVLRARQAAPRYWPPGMTDAHEIVRRALDARPEDYSLPEWARNEDEKPQPEVEDEPVPQPEGEPESESGWPPEPPRQPDLLPPPEPRAWQPGEADNTIVRGIKAITDADLAEYEASLAKYQDLQVPLTFERHGAKFYAKTPLGEFGFGDAGGLYEWRNRRRINYTGGDRQAVIHGTWLCVMTNPEPFQRGWAAAVHPYQFPTN